MEYIRRKTECTARTSKSAISKVFGIIDVEDKLIHVDDNVGESKQTFIKLHEVGHHQIPWHRKVFRILQDCEKTLSPDTADLFEREANNFARFILFQSTNYCQIAADLKLEIRTPMKLAKNSARQSTRLAVNSRGLTTCHAWSMYWNQSSIVKGAVLRPKCGVLKRHPPSNGSSEYQRILLSRSITPSGRCCRWGVGCRDRCLFRSKIATEKRRTALWRPSIPRTMYWS